MVLVRDFFFVLFWLGFAYWLLMLGRQLWFCGTFKPIQILIILCKDQEEIIEGLIRHLTTREQIIAVNRWSLLLADLDSQDRTLDILERLARKGSISINVTSLNGVQIGVFLQGLAEPEGFLHLVVLPLTGWIGGREICHLVDKILAGELEQLEILEKLSGCRGGLDNASGIS